MLHGSRNPKLKKAAVREWQQIGPAAANDQLYWRSSTDLLFLVRPSYGGRFIYEGANPAFEACLGLSSEDIYDKDISDCMGKEDAISVSEAFRACVAQSKEVRIRQHLAFGGPRRMVETTVVPIVDPMVGRVVRLMGNHRAACDGRCDIVTEGADQAHANIGLISIQDGIQERIASDLHDSTCQYLIAASLGLMRLRTSLTDKSRSQQLCDEIDTSIDKALKEIRGFAYLLHPQNLTVHGLKAAIEQYAEGVAARTSLQIHTRIVSDVDRLSHETKHALLRVVQEALTNVVRHARATETRIVINTAGPNFRLTISDNGRGFATDPASKGASSIPIGVGIPVMRARLQQVGGTFDIRSTPAMGQSGTKLCAIVPHGPVGNTHSRRKPIPRLQVRNREEH
jgi:anti-sigma regulatory factor (Ser/Thr protein kinase)